MYASYNKVLYLNSMNNSHLNGPVSFHFVGTIDPERSITSQSAVSDWTSQHMLDIIVKDRNIGFLEMLAGTGGVLCLALSLLYRLITIYDTAILINLSILL